MRKLLATPKTTAFILLLSASTAVGLLFLGDYAFESGWGAAPWIAWAGGTVPFLAPGVIIWALLMIPTGTLTGRWTIRFATVALASTIAGSVMQLLDDHVMNHAGTNNPLGFSLPLQDYLELPVLALMVICLVGGFVTMPGRILRSRDQKEGAIDGNSPLTDRPPAATGR